MKNQRRILVKLGGAALQSENALTLATEAISHFRSLEYEVLMVHGGGPAINNQLRLQGIEWTFSNGQRVTSAPMMEVIESTLCGHVNKRVVRHFCAHGLPAVGFSGIDNQTLLCTQLAADLGQVGQIQRTNVSWIETLLNHNKDLLPVIAPVGVNAEGKSFNINADWAAAHLAVAFKASELLFLTDQNGILDEEGSPIKNVDIAGLRNMVEARTVTGGMLTKTLAVIHALEQGVHRVRIMKCDDASSALNLSARGTACLKTLNSAERLDAFV